MSVNDILVQGAEPLFFLDYFACGKLDVGTATRVVKGIAAGCEQAGCALIGGETAEMPGMYPAGEYDLAGFAVGVVEKSAIIDGTDIDAGDVVLGLASSGVHSNGYSLVRKIIESSGADLSSAFDGGTLGDALLAPTRIYVKPVLAAMRQVRIKGLAHITGGGLVENVPRVLPSNVMAKLRKSAWPRPPLFDWLQKNGNVAEAEMHRVFNCGIGMVCIVAAADAEHAIAGIAQRRRNGVPHRRDRWPGRRRAADRGGLARGDEAHRHPDFRPRQQHAGGARREARGDDGGGNQQQSGCRRAWSLRAAAGLETAVVNHREYPDRASFDKALGDRISTLPARPDRACRIHAHTDAGIHRAIP